MNEPAGIIRKSKCSTDFKRNDFLKKTKRTHWAHPFFGHNFCD